MPEIKKIAAIEIPLMKFDQNQRSLMKSMSKWRKVAPENRSSVITKEACDTIVFLEREKLSYRGDLEAASLGDYLKKFNNLLH